MNSEERDTIPAPPIEPSEIDDIKFAVAMVDQLCGDTRNWGLQAAVRQHLQVILSNAEILAGDR